MKNLMSLNIITGNPHKFADITAFLKDSPFELTQIPLELEELQDLDAQRVIMHKIDEALKHGYTNFILEDTSLYIDGLKRLPGPFIKWFMSELSIADIFKLASCMGNGSATAETIVAYVDAHKNKHIFTGTTRGTIVEPRGNSGFGWAPIFQPTGSAKTYGEMTLNERQAVNQRAKALQKCKDFLVSSPNEV